MDKKPECGPNENCLEFKEKIRELEIINQRYKTMIEQSGCIFFECNLPDGTILFSANFDRILGREPVGERLPQVLLSSGSVHKDDTDRLKLLFEKVQYGQPDAEGEYRIKNGNGSYLWYRIHVSAVPGIISRSAVVGQITDITHQKNEMQALMEKAQHDELTGLLNKSATRQFVENSLTGSSSCAMFVIDVDHFKCINDNLGHLFGDAVLFEVGNCLKRLFRSSDIVGRIGGDEFLVLLKDASEPSLIQDKAKVLNRALNRTLGNAKGEYQISGSIGVAVCPKDGTSFRELFGKADAALYRAKRAGRNNCVIYQEGMEKEICCEVLPERMLPEVDWPQDSQ
jgi:diguanylate cyclase (GGDEF)-like protein/PAS domain S-box-containing protein